MQRLVMLRWRPTSVFAQETGNNYRHILAIRRNMPACAGTYEDGRFLLTDTENPVGNIFEGDIVWFTEQYSEWTDYPQHRTLI